MYIGYMQLDSNLDWRIRGSQSVDGIVQTLAGRGKSDE